MSRPEEDVALAAAMATEEFRQQQLRWRTEAVELRVTVRESWHAASAAASGEDDGAMFRRWWHQNSESVRTALIVTALQELPDTDELKSMLPVITPELAAPGALVREEETLGNLLAALASERENDNIMAKFGLGDDSDGGLFLDSPVGLDAMGTIRSCVLLKFAAAIMLLYIAEAENQTTEEILSSQTESG